MRSEYAMQSAAADRPVHHRWHALCLQAGASGRNRPRLWRVLVHM